jgi:hypothetical protein
MKQNKTMLPKGGQKHEVAYGLSVGAGLEDSNLNIAHSNEGIAGHWDEIKAEEGWNGKGRGRNRFRKRGVETLFCGSRTVSSVLRWAWRSGLEEVRRLLVPPGPVGR